MKILIADDEPLARMRLAGVVRNLTASDLVLEAGDGSEALRSVEAEHPDIVLLDIRMPGLDGFDLARTLNALRVPPIVIFTTAYDNHALQAYEVQAIDYLLKPVRRERLAQALDRAKRIARMRQSTENRAMAHLDKRRTQIGATWHGNLHVVPVAEIRYFRAEDKYVAARYVDGVVLIEDSLAALADEFKDLFLRVHRSALVAVRHIQGIEKDAVARYYVRLSDIDERVQVSRRLNAVVRKTIRHLNSGSTRSP